MRYPIFILLAALLGFAFLFGCDNPVINGDDIDSITTSPIATAKSIEDAINTNNMGELLNLYSSGMRFYFDPVEVGAEYDGHTVPEFWDANTDVNKLGLTITNGLTLEIDIDENAIGAPAKGDHTSPEIAFTADYQYSA
ncbi:MAG: hypothetical protein GY771_02055 [bacterium]|nr:hypothetical protein [bacterium]